MDSQSFEYWMAQGTYIAPPHQTTIFELPPDLAKVPSLSGSPVSSTYDHFPTPIHQTFYPLIDDEPLQFRSHPIPMTPSDFGSDHDSPPYCSPRPPPRRHAEQTSTTTTLLQPHISPSTEQPHNTTSGRRRAQNRAAQRAFRERKEKHARDLEHQLSVLSERYGKLETEYGELGVAYEKLRRVVGVFVGDAGDGVEGGAEGGAEGGDEGGKDIWRRRESQSDTLRKLLEILHGEVKSIGVGVGVGGMKTECV
ncbi:hypothetical protein T440DRAFT_450536 [Plenodomus tracheiphilus IPT5]|uniref:Putative transcription factor kapC n=1 Tax=Plenodomus tracheiphilus IPT5 TaxID=1408161 RepID=A0A6A7B857_9PLEO|nr:hypothetical protein T440DRAFT_450536 [Plenodomus tracheiphilus IPT5]